MREADQVIAGVLEFAHLTVAERRASACWRWVRARIRMHRATTRVGKWYWGTRVRRWEADCQANRSCGDVRSMCDAMISRM